MNLLFGLLWQFEINKEKEKKKKNTGDSQEEKELPRVSRMKRIIRMSCFELYCINLDYSVRRSPRWRGSIQEIRATLETCSAISQTNPALGQRQENKRFVRVVQDRRWTGARK